ncbi:hypothetical protein Tco_1032759 [Tanacetum coccineum]|uniref:Retrovirus-related Pol polyprotein from transposon TNT 1-94 n=1 Tax=Tanacetum coccineum TaxID=301880 RepID=A0ABQ5GDT3_9ASTR
MLTQQDINAIRAQRLANTHDPLALMANTQTPFHPDQSSLITYIQHPTTQQQLCPTTFIQHELHATTNANPEDITDPQLHRHSLELMSKAFHLNNTTPTNNNQRSSSNPCYSQIAQSREIVAECKNIWIGHECNSESRVYQNVGNQNRLSVFPEIANQYGNGNVVTTPAEGNGNGINGAYDEIEKVTANCNLQDNLQQASTSGTQFDKAPVYDSDRSAEVHHSENCYDNDIFNMFTQEEQYTELLEPIPEPHQVQQNDSNVISVVSSVEQACSRDARTMLIFSRAPLFLWAEAIATAKLDISFLYVFGALCYPKNDQEDIRKLCAKGDIGFFIGYSANSSMYDDYRGGQPSTAPRTVPAAQNIDELETQQQHAQHQPKVVADNVLNAMFDGNVFVNPFAPPSISDIESSSLLNVDPLNMHTFYQSYPHEYQWTKDHPLKQVIGEPSRSVLTRNQLRTDGDMCMYTLTVSTMEPSSVKESMQDPTWIESMQEELL